MVSFHTLLIPLVLSPLAGNKILALKITVELFCWQFYLQILEP